MNDFYIAYANWVIRWRWLIVPLMLALGILGTHSFITKQAFSDDYRVFFSAENPDLVAHETVERTYIAVDTVMYVLRPHSGDDIFKPDTLAAIAELTEAAWQLPYVVRVDSITSYQHTRADGDDLVVEYLIPDRDNIDAERVALVRDVAMNEPALFRRYISENGTTTAVVATVQMPDDVENVQLIVAPVVREIEATFRENHPDIRIGTGGHVMMSNSFFQTTQRDLGTLYPVMIGFFALTMIIFLRSFTATIAAMTVVILSVAAAMGTWFFLGVKLTPASGTTPVIILTVAIADSIHILVTIGKEMGKGLSRREAIVESLRINMQPVGLTSITTAIGFLSLNFSDAPPFRDLGNMAATGAIYAWMFSILLLPALMSFIPMRARKEGKFEQAALMGIMERVTRRPKTTITATFAVALGFAAFIPTVQINDKFVEFLSTDIPYRIDSDFASEHLPGIYDIAFSIGSGEEGGIANPEYLAKLGEFTDWLEQQPEIVHVMDFSDVMKRLNRSMHGDDPAHYRIPEDNELAAQYLLLYEMSLPYGMDLNNQINVPKSATLVHATMDNITSTQMKQIKWRAEAWMQDNLPPEMHARGTGITIIFAFLTQRNLTSMTFGTIMAIFLISVCLMIAFRSVKLGLLSLIPNFLPPIIAFGIWAAVTGEIGLYSAMVTATALGMIVDFTVHFLSKYLRARQEQGADVDGGIRYAFETVGSPLWISAFVLIAGFTVLAWSDFSMNANLGMFVSLIVGVALIADFVLLPAILKVVDAKDAVSPRAAPAVAE